MKTREIIIEPVIELLCEIEGQTYSRKIFENEIINLEIGDSIYVTVPYTLKENEREMEQITSLVGYNEEHFFVMVTLYENDMKVNEELVVLSYES